jgi:chitodextrinase
MTGVSIRATASGLSPETLLIDSTPATPTFLDAPLQVGATFTGPTVRVTTLSAGAGAASVSVEFGDWIDSEAPTAPTGVSAAQSAADVNLQWNASADNVGVSGYVVHRNGSLIGASPTTSFTDTSPRVGLNAYTVYAEDAAGNRSPGSAPKVLTVADLVAPSAPAILSAMQGSGGVNLHWSASTDNDRVARYVVYRDGSEVGAGPITVFTDTSAPAGRRTYTVYAEDEAGNRSPGSAPRAVAVIDPDGSSAPPDDRSEPKRKKASRLRPALRWIRRPNGTLAIAVDARRNPRVARVSLWLDGKLLRSKRGRVLRLIWKPPAAHCAGVYRFSARAYQPAGSGRVAATARNRALRLGRAC